MNPRVEVYAGLMLVVTVYAVWRGGRAERWGAGIWACTYLLSFAAVRLPIAEWHHLPPALVAADVMSAIAFAVLARSDDQYWLRWTLALQIFTVAAHAAVAIEPEILRWAYRIFIFGAGWGIVTLIAVGTRARVMERGRVPASSLNWFNPMRATTRAR